MASPTNNAAAARPVASGVKRSADEITTTARTFQSPPKQPKTDTNWTHAANIEDIIIEAYDNGHFHTHGWSFLRIARGAQFIEPAKFKSCLQLFDAVATDDDRLKLSKDLDESQVRDVAMLIADKAMKMLLLLEGKSDGEGSRCTHGYTGVGKRVRSIKTHKLGLSSFDKHTTLKKAIEKGAEMEGDIELE
jgi:hypothetical protein